MSDNTHHDEKIRLPRHVHRKRIKLIKRSQRRQQPYQHQEDKTEETTPTDAPDRLPPQPQRQTQAQKEEEDRAIYLAQKAQWEEKERQYNLINLARKKVIETEKKAREEAVNKWHASLRDLPTPKPPGYSSTVDGPTSMNTLQQPTVYKEFVRYSSTHTEPTRRKTYRDKFELAKKLS